MVTQIVNGVKTVTGGTVTGVAEWIAGIVALFITGQDIIATDGFTIRTCTIPAWLYNANRGATIAGAGIAIVATFCVSHTRVAAVVAQVVCRVQGIALWAFASCAVIVRGVIALFITNHLVIATNLFTGLGGAIPAIFSGTSGGAAITRVGIAIVALFLTDDNAIAANLFTALANAFPSIFNCTGD